MVFSSKEKGPLLLGGRSGDSPFSPQLMDTSHPGAAAPALAVESPLFCPQPHVAGTAPRNKSAALGTAAEPEGVPEAAWHNILEREPFSEASSSLCNAKRKRFNADWDCIPPHACARAAARRAHSLPITCVQRAAQSNVDDSAPCTRARATCQHLCRAQNYPVH